MIRPSLRDAAAGCAIGLTLAVSFPDSVGLWPLRLLSAWPGELGRAFGNWLSSGRFGPLGLGQAPDLELSAQTLQGRAFAALLGLLVALAGAVGLLLLAALPTWPRRFFAGLAAAALIAALFPPVGPLSAAELGAALLCGVLAATPEGSARTLGLSLLAGTVATAPLADLRPLLLGIGRASGAMATLENATGIAATALAPLCFALFAGALFLLARHKPSSPTTPAVPSPEASR